MIKLQISDIHRDPENTEFTEPYEVILYIEGRLFVELNSRIFFNEQICIVELAFALRDWRNKGLMTSFYYESMDNEELHIFDVNLLDNGVFSFSSAWQESEVADTFSRDDIIEFIENYLEKVKILVLERFHIHLSV